MKTSVIHDSMVHPTHTSYPVDNPLAETGASGNILSKLGELLVSVEHVRLSGPESVLPAFCPPENVLDAVHS
jgi:hypothetical protein